MKKLLFFLMILGFASVHASLLEEIALFPADFQNGKYSFNENNLAPLRISFRGDGSALAEAEKTELVLQLPDFLEVCAACTLHPIRARMLEISCVENTARIVLPDAYLIENIRTQFPWACGINLYFRAKAGAAGKQGTVKITLEKDGVADELSKLLRVTGAAPLPPVYRKLKKFTIGHEYFHATECPDRTIFEQNLQFWKDLCERPICSLSNAMLSVPDKTRISQLMDEFEVIYLLYSSMDTIVPVGTKYGFFEAAKVTRAGVPKLQDKDGVEMGNGAICPQYLIDDPEGIYWGKNLPEGIQMVLNQVPNLKNVSVNYESHPENGTCDACRTEFARQEKLSAVPTREEIRAGNPLHIRWRHFRERQRTKIIARYYQTMKKHFPQLDLWICTVSLRPGEDPVMAWSGINPKSYGPYTDVYYNMLYCAGKAYFDMLEYNLKELNKPLYPLIDPAETDIRWFRRYTPDTVRQNILATAAFGCRKILLYPKDHYDASYLTMIRDVCNAVAEAEDAFETKSITENLKTEIINVLDIELLDGEEKKTVSYPDMTTELRTFLHNDGKNYYATLFNFSSHTEIFCKVAIPDYQGDAAVVDLISRLQYEGVTANLIREGFLVKLPPNGALLLKFGAYDHLRGTVSQDLLNEELKSCLAALQIKSSFLAAQKEGNSVIQWVIGKKGKPVVQLRENKAYIEFDHEDGGIVSNWRIPGFGNGVPGMPGENFFGELHFQTLNTAIPATLPFQLEKLHFIQKHAAAEMSYTVPPDLDAGGQGNPLENLKIIRENIMLDSFGSYQIRHTFVNQSTRPMTFGLRLKNIPIFRWKPGEGLQALLANGTEIPIGTHTYIKPGATIQWSDLGTPVLLDDLAVTIRHKDSGLSYRINGDFDGLYAWANQQIQTIEPLSSTFTLDPGQTRIFTFRVDVNWEKK